MRKFSFVRNVEQSEYGSFPKSFKKDEEIFEFDGHDYGCVRDDYDLGHRATVACSLLAGQNPFFTVPVELIVDEAGKHPVCRYEY